ELRPVRDWEILRHRHVEVVEGRLAGEEPRCFVALAPWLRRREAFRVIPLPVRIAAISSARVAGERDPRVRVTVGTGAVAGDDARNGEVHRVGASARPPVDA